METVGANVAWRLFPPGFVVTWLWPTWILLCLNIFCAFILDRTAEEWTGNQRERREGGIEPIAAVARTQPLYMGRLLYQLSYQGAPITLCFDVKIIDLGRTLCEWEQVEKSAYCNLFCFLLLLWCLSFTALRMWQYALTLTCWRWRLTFSLTPTFQQDFKTSQLNPVVDKAHQTHIFPCKAAKINRIID